MGGALGWLVLEDQDEANRDHWRLAWWSVNQSETEDVKGMLRRGEVSKDDPAEMLPMAVKDDSEQAVTTLLRLGVNTRAKDVEGHTAFQLARLQHNGKMTALLQHAGARE